MPFLDEKNDSVRITASNLSEEINRLNRDTILVTFRGRFGSLYLNSLLRLFTLTGAALAPFLLDLDAHATMANWRTVARSARIELDKQRYGAAEQGYMSALRILSEQSAGAEEIFDLKLLLVETYRRENQYGRAEEILNSIEPAIAKNKFADPTIAVRFWRRRAELRCSEGRFDEGIFCMKKAIVILEKYFQRNSETLLSNYTTLLRLACDQSDWQTISFVLGKLHSETPDSKSVDLRKVEELRQARKLALSLVSDRTAKLLAARDYMKAMLLIQLMASEGDDASGIHALIDAMRHETSAKQYEKAATIVPYLNDALDKVNQTAKGGISLLIEGHAEIACLYEFRGQGELQLSEWKKVLELFTKQGADHSFMDGYHAAHARNRIATISEFKPAATERALQLINESLKFCRLPTSMHLMPGELAALRTMHMDTKICCSWAHQTRKEWKESESCLDSIDAEALNHSGNGSKCTVAGQRLSVGDGYRMSGNIDGYRRNFALGKSMLARVPDGPERRSVMDYLGRIAAEAAPSKAAKEGALK